MGVIKKTSNTHQTSLLVSEHIPDFIRSDHPKFVTFIEKYYEFLAQEKSGIKIGTAEPGTWEYYNLPEYYGVDYASKAITDIHDIDTTDLDKFIESFRRQYAITLPSKVYTLEDTRLLYKNILNFYRALGTEDSFKMLFRLLYDEEIEIYYPKEDILIASGGNYIREARVKVKYTDNIDKIKNSKLIGSTSGAYGTVEDVNILPIKSNRRISGKIAKTSSPYVSGVSNSQTYDSDKFLEMYDKEVYVTLTDQHGNFELFESVYYIKDNELPSSISNTTILPVPLHVVFSDDFSSVESANNIVSFDDGLLHRSSLSTYTPWGSANIGFSNTGFWHATGSGQGEIHVYANTFSDTVKTPGRTYLRIGNNTTSPSSTGDLRQLVWSGNIPIPGDNTLYKLSVTARDVGGNSAASIAEGNRFSAGVACIRHDFSKIDSEYQDTYDNPLWLASHQQAIDDEFFTYTAYFKGRQQTHDVASVYPETYYGNGGRIDLTSGTRYYNSIHKAIEGKVLLPFNTTWFKPTIKVNEPVGATYSQGITDIALVQIEEIGAMQSNFGNLGGKYRDDASLLSTKGAHLQDGYYRQVYAYDIRSQQQMKDYNTVVRKTVHPAGLKMFGTQVVTSANNISIVAANSNLTESFSPSSINSLAGWWAADTIVPDNIEWKQAFADGTANGIYGTNINRLPVGISGFEDVGSVPSAGMKSSALVEGVTLGYDGAPGPSPVIGSRALKVTDRHTSTNPRFWSGLFNESPGTTNPYAADANTTPYDYNIILEPRKKWLMSCYVAVSNVASDVTFENSFFFELYSANNIGSTGNISGHLTELLGSKDRWYRRSSVIDLSSSDETRFAFAIRLANRSSFVEETGNTVYHFDGLMLEEYDPDVHGTETLDGSVVALGGQATPSAYSRPGFNAANVISWYDQSPNKHHVYANTHGGILFNPQYVTNAINGQPGIRFRSVTANNVTGAEIDQYSNTYAYGTIGGTISATFLKTAADANMEQPTAPFQSANSTLADPTLQRPVANAWTLMVVGKMNKAFPAGGGSKFDGGYYKDNALTYYPTPFVSGFEGHRYGPYGVQHHHTKKIRGSSVSLHVDSFHKIRTTVSSNSTAYRALRSPNLEGGYASMNTYFMFGVSEYAGIFSEAQGDFLNLHHNGRRYANSELAYVQAPDPSAGEVAYTSEHDGMVWQDQQDYRTSIGGWAPGNSVSGTGGNHDPYGYFNSTDPKRHWSGHAWDGDISEVIVFNEKLSNTSLALVEGYLAHKYGLEESLLHKDGDNAANTYEYKWTFANTEDGWIASGGNGSVTKQDNPHANLIFTTSGSSGADQAIEIDFPSHPIDGSGFDEFKIRVMRVEGSDPGGTWEGTLTWTTEDSRTHPSTNILLLTGHGKAVISNETADGVFEEHYVDLSSMANWTSNQVTGLKFWFKTATDASETYYIDEISVYNSSRKHHPFRYDAPTSIHKFANNWYKDY